MKTLKIEVHRITGKPPHKMTLTFLGGPNDVKIISQISEKEFQSLVENGYLPNSSTAAFNKDCHAEHRPCVKYNEDPTGCEESIKEI